MIWDRKYFKPSTINMHVNNISKKLQSMPVATRKSNLFLRLRRLHWYKLGSDHNQYNGPFGLVYVEST